MNNNANKNNNETKGNFVIYQLRRLLRVLKIGKADKDNLIQSTGLPKRIHDQLEMARWMSDGDNGDLSVDILAERFNIRTAEAKQLENWFLQAYYDQHGEVPPGNAKTFKPNQSNDDEE